MAKPTIVTRATKGSALTWTEGDANFTNLKDATVTIKAGTGGTDVVSDLNGTVTLVAGTNVTLTGDNTAKTITIDAAGGGGGDVVDDTTPQLGGDLDVNGNDITAALDANVNIVVTGEGTINLSHGDPESGSVVQVGNGTDYAVIVSNGATDLILGANDGAATIAVGADGFVFLTPGTGSSVEVESPVTRLGTGAAAATLTTNGAYNLTLSTNNGTVANVPTITLTSAGGIALQATTGSSVSVNNSTLVHNMNSSVTGSAQFFSQAHATADANNFTLARARNTTLSPSAVQTGDELAEFYVAGHDGQTGLAGYEPAWGFNTTVTGTPSSNVMPVRTDYVINTGASTLSTYHSIGTDLVFRVAELGTISGVTDLFISGGTNGNIELSPDGTGQVLITSAVQVGGDITAATGSGQDLTLAGDGTGNVNLNSDTVRIGDNNTAATLTTHGTGNLILNTHNGTNSGSITIAQGANSNITLAPNGTGTVVISGNLQIDGTTTTVNSTTLDVDDINITIAKGAANAAAANGGGITLEGPTTAATITYASADDSWNTNKKTAVPELQVDNININGNTITSTNTNGDIFITPNGTGDVDLVADTVQIGDLNTAATLTTNGTGNLVLNTNNGTNSGSITIAQGVNGNITLTPNGTGDVNIDADTVRIGDSGSTASLSSNNGGLFIYTPGTQNLELATNGGGGGNITITGADNGNITLTPNGTGDVHVSADTLLVGDINSAALVTSNGSGSIKLNTNAGTNSGEILINSGANSNIEITPNGTGQTIIKNLEYNEAVFNYGNSGTLTWTPNATNGNVQTITLTGNLTLNAFSSPVSGQTITFIITQDGTGSRTLTSTMKFAGGSKTLSTAANSIDILTVSYIGTTYYASLAKGYV